MSVAPTRRFHEEGVGARTGLRIGDVPRDADGNYNVDAFLEAAKRGLMIESDEDESLASTSASRDPTPEPAPTDWDQRVSHISELAVSSLGNVDETSRVSALRRDDSMWESSVEVSADRTFNLTELAGDVQPSPPSMRRIERRERERRSTMLPMPSMDDVSWLRHSTRSPLDDSLRDTTLRESTRSNIFAEDSGRGPGRSFLGHDSVDASLAPASSPLGRPPSLDGRAPSVDRSRSATPLAPLMEADMGYPDTYSDAGESEGGYSELMPEPPKKRGRGRPRKSEALHAAVAAGYPLPRGKPGRPPGRQMPPQKIVEQIHDPPSWQIENPEGLRRGKRHRIAPLDWWRGERALYGRAEANNESVPKVPFGLVAPVLKEVIRVPRAPGEGTFSGMRRFKPKPTMYIPQQGSQRMYSATPEIPVDRDTDPYGVVYDAEMEQDVDMRITCTAESLRPQPAFNRQFLYEKVFTIGDYMAAGKLVIEQGGEKQPKSSKDNNYIFIVSEGAVEATVHRTKFVIAEGGMFCVPKENTYVIKNISDQDAHLYFAQARFVPPTLEPVTDGQPGLSQGSALRAMQAMQETEASREIEAPRETRPEPREPSPEAEAEEPSDEEADEGSASDDEYDFANDSRLSRR